MNKVRRGDLSPTVDKVTFVTGSPKVAVPGGMAVPGGPGGNLRHHNGCYEVGKGNSGKKSSY